MKRRQKRYTTEEQITSEIDAKKLQAEQYLKEAVECDAVVELCYKKIAAIESGLESANEKKRKEYELEIHALQHKADLHKKRAVTNSKRRNGIQNTTLPKLKNCLAAFRTGLLKGVTDDPAVVK